MKQSLTGGEIVVRSLIANGVPLAVGIPGHGNLALTDALRKNQDRLKVLMPRTETGATYMADGYYRVTGQPLAVFTSIGPGALNPAIGVATAYVDSTAVLLLTGDAHTYMRGKGVLQEIERHGDSDFHQVYRPITKRCWLAGSPVQLPSIMNRAFIEMTRGRPGPVLVSLPMDVQADTARVAVQSTPACPSPTAPPAPGRDGIERALRLMATAKRPVILAGGGVLRSGGHRELRRLAEIWGAAVLTTLPAKGVFPEDHALAGWLTGSKGTGCGLTLSRTADVILAVGCRFADETACSYRHGVAFAIPPAKLIHVDIDPGEIGKNYPVEVGICADARLALAALAEALGDEKAADRQDYRAEVAALRDQWLAQLAAGRQDDATPMTVSAMLRQVRAALPRDAFVVSSSGNTQAQILQEFPFYEPYTNVTTGGFSTMGFALPAAMGVKLAHPDREVVGVTGDGDFLMTVNELATAAQYDIPVVIVVLNNHGWQAIRDLQVSAYGAGHAMAVEWLKAGGDLYATPIADIARAFGCHAQRVESAGQVRSAVKRALASGRPAVVEAVGARDVAGGNGQAAGWWDVPVPGYLSDRRARYERQRSQERV